MSGYSMKKLVSQYEAGEKLRQPLLMPILMNVDVSAAESETDGRLSLITWDLP